MTMGVSVNIWVMFIILTYSGSRICKKKKNFLSNGNTCDTVVKEVHDLVRLFLMKHFCFVSFPHAMPFY